MVKKILIVDDDELITSTLKTFLEKFNFEVKTANDGYEAVKICTIENFDLILMDIIMPNMNGIEAIKALKIIYPDINIWIISGNLTKEIKDEAIKNGITKILEKPLSMNFILKEIKEL
ncbi:MAG TPA: response regulator [bacterium]|mgnify:CR=1 FL=1|nr:response regulator [bacterium]HOL47851.1 response regulator [bacterium]HPQ19851.1 response regulator [bacterium]